MGCAGIKWVGWGWGEARDDRLGVGGCLTEMDRGLLGGACLEWGLSGWAGQPYGNMGERQAGALDLAEEEEEEKRKGGGGVYWNVRCRDKLEKGREIGGKCRADKSSCR